jgi:hypothetical protein
MNTASLTLRMLSTPALMVASLLAQGCLLPRQAARPVQPIGPDRPVGIWDGASWAHPLGGLVFYTDGNTSDERGLYWWRGVDQESATRLLSGDVGDVAFAPDGRVMYTLGGLESRPVVTVRDRAGKVTAEWALRPGAFAVQAAESELMVLYGRGKGVEVNRAEVLRLPTQSDEMPALVADVDTARTRCLSWAPAQDLLFYVDQAVPQRSAAPDRPGSGAYSAGVMAVSVTSGMKREIARIPDALAQWAGVIPGPDASVVLNWVVDRNELVTDYRVAEAAMRSATSRIDVASGRIETVFEHKGVLFDGDISPDARTLALSVSAPETGYRAAYAVDLRSRASRLLVDQEYDNGHPLFLRDNRVAFWRSKGPAPGLYVVHRDGTGMRRVWPRKNLAPQRPSGG